MDPLASMQAHIDGLAAHLGIRLLSVSSERLTAEMEIRADLCAADGIAHGGTLMAFADTLGGMATGLNLRGGNSTSTLESKTNFFAPALVGTTVTGESVPLHRGRRTMVWQTRITNADGRLLAMVTQTQMVIEGRR